MELHPYLAAVPDWFVRLVRANYWLIADPDFRHADYWRAQVRLCEAGVLSQHLGSPHIPADVRARREVLVKQQIGVAMRDGYHAASRWRHAGGTDVPGATCC